MLIKKEKGITLIALVITIIILLILAGISIAMLTGDNGILNKATTAEETTKQATAEEKVKIAVAGSYDTSGKISIDDLNSNLENIEGIDKSGLPLTQLPATVVIDGYTFLIEQNGKVELSGPRPVVGNLTVTLEDGSQIPEDGAEIGTKLKIDFTATIEGGTIEAISPVVPYTTNGTEKEVRFTITGKVDGVTYTTQKTISLKDYYVKTEFEASDIAKKPTEFYGSIVENYTVNANASEDVKSAVTTWRIFYVGKEPNGTEDNIYLIADDYIPYIAMPNGKEGTPINKKDTDYRVGFDKVINDYNGGKFIWENSLGKNWLSKYLNYTTDNGATYPNRGESTHANIKVTAYLMDTNVWNEYAGEKAKYAMGGPTLEMYMTSYINTHIESNANCSMYNEIGYKFQYKNTLSSDYNKIYIIPEQVKAGGVMLASPSYGYGDGRGDCLVIANGNWELYGDFNYRSNGGYRYTPNYLSKIWSSIREKIRWSIFNKIDSYYINLNREYGRLNTSGKFHM